METLIYEDASDIPESKLKGLVKPQVQCWGSAPFNEYKICADKECGRLIGIEEVHRNEGSQEIWNEEADNFACPDCNEGTNYIYGAEEFLEELKKFVVQNVWCILLQSGREEVSGFALARLSNIKSLIDYEFATRPNSYNKKELQQKLSQSIFSKNNAPNENVVLLHHIYLKPELRLEHSSHDLFCKLLEHSPDDYSSLPLVLETKYNSKIYPNTRSLGFNDVANDQYGYVAQTHPSYGDLQQQLTSMDGYRDLLPSMGRYKKEVQMLMEKHPEFQAPYYYNQ